MEDLKLAIIYYSSTGTNYQLSNWAKEAAEEVGVEVKLLKVEELAPPAAIESNKAWKKHHEATKEVPVAKLEDVDWADALIFSIPTRFGNLPSQMKQYLDLLGGLWAQGKTINKVVSAMSSAQNPHGGQEQTIHALYTSMMHFGAIIVPTGYTDESIFAAGGNPYGTSVSVDSEGNMQEDVQSAVRHQTKRIIQIAKWIKNGLASL